ncbi:SWIM zinc finger family protein [Antrihabitans sp. YC2-6]|uniref:SWIM zinc finger family protein n=1 Tax=Antrihabitans sp. YC2-6 TaxID=2799498 RepID=UPI0018F4B027|nr:SWIM zinc finger family protein [Antrihabitans sp. YC2-6]MBJ8348111.1 SWIM zinc finger family protein [Antrihabitans sp. YC2-6]
MSPARGRFNDFSQYGKRRPVVGGVEARSRRGSFGSTWWGRALLDAVEGLADSGRLARGKTYARAGQVVAIQVGSGAVTAEVQGSQPLPFTSTLSIKPLDDDAIAELIDTVRSTPGMLAEIASGSVPRDLGPLLLPSRASELDFDCTCPDSGWPCKHVAAVAYLTAEHIDEKLLDILTLRGIDFDTLISGVEADPVDIATDDPYGDRIELPALPKVNFTPAMDDLDPAVLRRALRTLADSEKEVATTVHELSSLYARLSDYA